MRKNFVDEHATIHEARAALGRLDPILSKLALITTCKDGVYKHRLILDCRISGSDDRAVNVERALLPGAWNVVHDTLMMKTKANQEYALRYLVLDFKDAFFMLPLRPEECRYYCSSYKGRYYIWRRIAPGSAAYRRLLRVSRKVL